MFSCFPTANILAGLIELNCSDINEGDFSGCGPLIWAAQNGHEAVVEILLGQGEVNPDELDIFVQTPLSCAPRMGHEGVVKMLLERKEVNPDKPDKWGQTPLSYAALCGTEGMVKVVLGREEVNPDKPDNDGQTPLSWASSYGHEGVVKILLEREEVNPDKPDQFGQTPLSLATRNGHERVVALLQSCKVISPRYGLSPKSHRLVEITPDPSLSRHATPRDALRNRPLLTRGIHEIGMNIYFIPFCIFFVIFLGRWVISEFLFLKSF